jgi:hypothetical protein
MPGWAWILIAVGAVVIVVVVAAWLLAGRRRRERLRSRFGSEYERVVSERGSRRSAEAELERREAKRERLDVVSLAPAARDRYVSGWREVQARFVDDPSSAVVDADRLVTEVLRDRGYPMDEFEQRAADISVDYPHVVEHYRAGHAIYLASDRGEASTEELRQAFVHYRALFDELLETEDETVEEVR